MSNFSFCHSYTSIPTDIQCLVKKYCLSSLVFNVKIGFNDIGVSLIRKYIQSNAKKSSVKTRDFHSCLTKKCRFLVLRNVPKHLLFGPFCFRI